MSGRHDVLQLLLTLQPKQKLDSCLIAITISEFY